jgi:hypothetical protein
MINVSLLSVGLVGPGLPDWQRSAALLSGETPYQPESVPPLTPALLKPNERRRTSNTIKLALQAASDALSQTPPEHERLSVFASSEGDLDILNQICTALSQQGRPVSPTQFHNSVHNAAAGYWSIACGHQQASTSLAGLQGTFASGLLEAALQAATENMQVLLVAYDHPSPFPLDQIITLNGLLAVALLLAPHDSDTKRIAELFIDTSNECADEMMADAQMEAIRLASPTGKSLPLLSALAQQCRTSLHLPYLPELDLKVEIRPC